MIKTCWPCPSSIQFRRIIYHFARAGSIRRTYISAPGETLIADHPKAVLLFCFLDGFRCSVWLFIVYLVRYKNRSWAKMDV